MLLLAPLAAVLVAAAVPRAPTLAQERALRRRIVRLARIKMLERRQALLLSFLAKAHTETLLFEKATVNLGGGLEVGPTIVTLDFLGSPIVRAQVRNASTQRASALLTAHLRAANGAQMSASIMVDRLEPGTVRSIELLCPCSRAIAPTAVWWSAML